jgi:hypothetical protein
MACLITKGRATNCKSQIGGINRIWLTDFGGLGTITLGSNDEVTDATGTATFFQYDLKGSGNTMETTANVSRDNGTAFFSTVLTITLPKLTKEDQKEWKLISHGRPHIIIEDRNSNFFLMGKEHGAELTSGSMSTGGGFADASQYSFEFTSEEALPPNFIDGATSSNPVAGLSSCTETIIVGTNS